MEPNEGWRLGLWFERGRWSMSGEVWCGIYIWRENEKKWSLVKVVCIGLLLWLRIGLGVCVWKSQ